MDVYGALRAAGVADRQARLAANTISRQQERIVVLENQLTLVRVLLFANVIITLTLVGLHLAHLI